MSLTKFVRKSKKCSICYAKFIPITIGWGHELEKQSEGKRKVAVRELKKIIYSKSNSKSIGRKDEGKSL